MAERESPRVVSYVHTPIFHTAHFLSDTPDANDEMSRPDQTVYGEDLVTVNHLLEDLLRASFDFETARNILAPRIAAGLKSERKYRRDCHRELKRLGHIAGREFFGAAELGVTENTAAKMLNEFVDATLTPDTPKVGLELGHIELVGARISADHAWRQLADHGERIADLSHLEKIDAQAVSPSDRAAIFTGIDAQGKEIKLPRARTNFPVVDIGRTGVQLFVRVAVGYDTVDQSPMSLRDVRSAHKVYMADHTSDTGIARLDDNLYAYPIAATLVTLNRNLAA